MTGTTLVRTDRLSIRSINDTREWTRDMEGLDSMRTNKLQKLPPLMFRDPFVRPLVRSTFISPRPQDASSR